MEKPTMEEAESKGLEAEASPASQDVDDSFRTRDVVSGAGVGVGVDGVVRIPLMSGSADGVNISLSVVPSGEQDNVAAGGMSCSALGGGASVGCGLV